MKLNRALKGMLLLEGLLLAVALAWRGDRIVVHERAREARRAAHRHWRPCTPAETQRATSSIVQQLDAFKRNDYGRAAEFQSEYLRHSFSTLAQFRQMIRSGYPEFARYKTVKFGPASTNWDAVFIRIPVTLTGQDGITVHALYVMVLEEGVYRVDGVEGGMPPSPPAPGSGVNV